MKKEWLRKEGVRKAKKLGGEKKEKMKTKNKMIALVEIAIMLCSVFLVAIPAIAADQTMQKASASEVTAASAIYEPGPLDIYGNANEDDTIDMGDVVYIKLAIFGKKPKTELCDGKYDGRINVLDVIQTKLIILGKEKEITILDGNGDATTVSKPVERIIVDYMDNAELIRILNAKDKVVGISEVIKEKEIQFPELSKLPSTGRFCKDYEFVLNLNPDLLLTFGAKTATKKEKLPGVAVVFLGLYYPDLSNPEVSKFTTGVRKMGYILDKEDEAEEYINWRIGGIDEIKSRTEGLPENEKPRVLMCARPQPGTKTFGAYTMIDTFAQMGIMAGGKNIIDDLPEFVQPLYKITVDPEWVIEQNPEFILVHNARWAPVHGYDTDDPTGMGNPAGMTGIRDELMNRPELATVNAVKTGNVYIMAGNFRNDASGGLVGAAYLAKVFHPDLFEDLDPETVHQEYLDLQHFDYDLDEHGVFFYPPIEIDSGLAGIPDRYKGQI